MSKSRRSTTRRAAASSAQQAPMEFNPDYTDVKTDLKRIGILAGTFIALLVALSFFLR